MDYNKVYTKPHGSGANGNGKTIIINKGNKQNGFDPQYVNVVNLDAHNANITNLTATNANIDNAEFVYIMSANGVIKKLEGDEIRYKDGVIDALSSSEIATNKLTVKDEANITKLIADYIQSTNITTDYLTVNKSAHFFELIIDKIRSVQGTQMNTAANCIADYVEAYVGIYHDNRDSKVSLTSNNVDYFRIYWKNADNDGRAITNDWLVNDQAICESFNVHPGVTYDTQNKYYWRLVEATDGGSPVYINFDTEEISTTAPQDYEILFVNGFSYGDDVDPTDNYTDFVIHSQIGHYVDGQWVDDEWDNNTYEFTPSSTLYGLQLTLATNGDTLKGGKLIFETDIQTKLNVGVYYDDNTYEYFPADVYKYSYVIETSSDKCVEAIVINTAIIDKWDACNWIDLSNVTCDTGVSGKSAIPTIGDNICQLGYRYNNLANPTQDDIARASAIIIAAYNTPDNGVKPPSYAQYQNITDFSLTTHRGSYFDATGCYIVGNFAVQAAGSVTPLEDYIKSFNNANPLEGFISTNNNQIVDLVVLQTDNSDKIYDLNNFPNNLQVMVNYEGTPQMDISDYDALTLTLFGVSYDLLEANNYTPNLPSSYQGIYVSNITKSQYQPFRLTLAFTGNEQVITTSSMILHAEITNSGTTYQLNKNIPINSVSSVEGTDAELWQLYKDTEYAEVQRNKSLNVQLRYAIQHVVGITSTIVAPTNQKLKITRYKLDGTALNTTILTSADYISNGGKTGSGYWEYTYTLANWYTEQNKPIYFLVELLDSNNNILSNTIVDITLESSSLFTVEDGLTQSIQANTTTINDEVQTRQTQYSTITQTVNNINSTVSSHTTSINNMSSEISQIDQKADRIGLHVDSVETDLNGVVTDLSSTGIDIEQGKITLTAENTTIDGNLNLTGNFESYNAQYMNRTIINTNASQMQGLVMRGPNSIDTSTGLPTPGATETDLIRLDFQASAGPQSGQMTLYSRNNANNYMQINSQEILLNNSNGSVDIDLGGINYSSLDTQYDRTWEELFCNKLRTHYINTGTGYTVVDSDMITDIFLVAVSGDFGFYLPYPGPAWDGKRFYIKKINNSGDLRLVTTDRNGNEASYLLDGNDSSPQSSHWYDRYSVTVICAGNYWIVFRGDD